MQFFLSDLICLSVSLSVVSTVAAAPSAQLTSRRYKRKHHLLRSVVCFLDNKSHKKLYDDIVTCQDAVVSLHAVDLIWIFAESAAPPVD